MCQCDGTIVYGVDDGTGKPDFTKKYALKQGPAQCSNEEFGEDVAPGVAK